MGAAMAPAAAATIQQFFADTGTRPEDYDLILTGDLGQVGSDPELSPTPLAAARNLADLAALIAVNLAVMNLLPLPALDGGRVFFLLLNSLLYGLFRKEISPKYEGYVHLAGLAALMCLMLAVTLSDVGKLFGR